MALLEVRDIVKRYGTVPALDGVGFDLEEGDILCLLGASGSGKTSLLRVVAGLETPDRGRVVFDGRDMRGVEPHRRQFGMMFQEYALFPHKDVFENVAFGLRVQKRSGEAVHRRVTDVLDLVGLEGFGSRRVSDLSGGERQRVALARSLAPQPRLLMLDEPLGSLDRALRDRLTAEVRRILKAVGVTSIFVTHDQAEAFGVADWVAVLDRGRLEQLDRPEELYRHPRTEVVAGFLGFRNLLTGRMAGGGRLETDLGPLLLDTRPPEDGGPVTVVVRPEAARIIDGESSALDVELSVAGRVIRREFQGRHYYLGVETPAGPMFFDLGNETPPPGEGERVVLALAFRAMVLLADRGDD